MTDYLLTLDGGWLIELRGDREDVRELVTEEVVTGRMSKSIVDDLEANADAHGVAVDVDVWVRGV